MGLFDFRHRKLYNILPNEVAAIVCEYKKSELKGGSYTMKELKFIEEVDSVITYAELDKLDRRDYDKLIAYRAELEAQKLEQEQALMLINETIVSVDAQIAKAKNIIELANAAQPVVESVQNNQEV